MIEVFVKLQKIILKYLKAIEKDFGSYDKFVEEFKKAAKDVFGSGWAWLVRDNNGKLSITTTSNQDSPISENLIPIIGIDVWEHAYYLQYKNDRDSYINNFWNKANFDYANKKYEETFG